MSMRYINFFQLGNTLQFTLSKSKDIEDFFIAEINNREKTIKKLNKYITPLDYTDKTLIVSSGTSNRVSLCSFTTVIHWYTYWNSKC